MSCKSDDDCLEIKILAPIYEENSKCIINWNTSTYLENNAPWDYISTPDNNIIIFAEYISRSKTIKVRFMKA